MGIPTPKQIDTPNENPGFGFELWPQACARKRIWCFVEELSTHFMVVVGKHFTFCLLWLSKSNHLAAKTFHFLRPFQRQPIFWGGFLSVVQSESTGCDLLVVLCLGAVFGQKGNPKGNNLKLWVLWASEVYMSRNQRKRDHLTHTHTATQPSPCNMLCTSSNTQTWGI